jgi:hypothetical protein
MQAGEELVGVDVLQFWRELVLGRRGGGRTGRQEGRIDSTLTGVICAARSEAFPPETDCRWAWQVLSGNG